MFIGIVRLTFQIPGAQSLKDRRRVVKSFKERVRAKFAASVAEVGEVEQYQRAEIGVALVTREAHPCEELLNAVVALATGLGQAWLVDSQSRVLPFKPELTSEQAGWWSTKAPAREPES